MMDRIFQDISVFICIKKADKKFSFHFFVILQLLYVTDNTVFSGFFYFTYTVMNDIFQFVLFTVPLIKFFRM